MINESCKYSQSNEKKTQPFALKLISLRVFKSPALLQASPLWRVM